MSSKSSFSAGESGLGLRNYSPPSSSMSWSTSPSSSSSPCLLGFVVISPLPRQSLRQCPRRHRHRRRRRHRLRRCCKWEPFIFEHRGRPYKTTMMELADCERQRIAADGAPPSCAESAAPAAPSLPIGTEIIPPIDTQITDPWLQQTMNPYFKGSLHF